MKEQDFIDAKRHPLPVRCPFCKSANIHVDTWGDYNDDSYFDSISCRECSALWTLQYDYVGFNVDKEPMK